MLKRLLVALVLAVFAGTSITACSATDNKNLSGQGAQDALATVVSNSVKEFDKAGGSETLVVGKTQYVVIYDPSAPEGEQVVSANLTDNSAPTLEDPSAISIHALSELVGSSKVKEAEVSLTKNVFTIQGSDFLVELFVTDDLIYKSNIWSTAAGTQDPQVVVTTYGLDKATKELFDSATAKQPTP